MSIYDFSVRTADGGTADLRQYAGEVLLIVNVASQCGFTPQYEGLEALYREDKDRGLRVLGFPCNQFGEQEPGSDAEIQEFCGTSYDVTFPVFGKIDVNGPGADPLYGYLRAAAPGEFGPANGRVFEHVRKVRPEALGTDEIKWNFTKFVIDRNGEIAGRYESNVTPEQLRPALEQLLAS